MCVCVYCTKHEQECNYIWGPSGTRTCKHAHTHTPTHSPTHPTPPPTHTITQCVPLAKQISLTAHHCPVHEQGEHQIGNNTPMVSTCLDKIKGDRRCKILKNVKFRKKNFFRHHMGGSTSHHCFPNQRLPATIQNPILGKDAKDAHLGKDAKDELDPPLKKLPRDRLRTLKVTRVRP